VMLKNKIKSIRKGFSPHPHPNILLSYCLTVLRSEYLKASDFSINHLQQTITWK
jgi:hypothetical protein